MRTLVLVSITVLALVNAGWAKCAGFYRAFEWAPDGSYVDLGTLPGGTNSWAYDINKDGQVAGCSSDSAGKDHAVRWDKTGGIVDLGPGRAYGINDLGQVVGTSNGRAVLWDTDGTMHDLAPGVAMCLNNSGQVAGTTGGQNSEAFTWSASAGLTALGKLPGTIGSTASGINSEGSIAGTSLVNDDWSQATTWSNRSGWTIIGDGRALAINSSGEVAGNSYLGQAFFWSSSTGRINIRNVTAAELNSSGQLVGYSCTTNVNSHAVLWQNGSPLVDLGVPTGYLWSKANGINDRRQVVGVAVCVSELPSATAPVVRLSEAATRGSLSPYSAD